MVKRWLPQGFEFNLALIGFSVGAVVSGASGYHGYGAPVMAVLVYKACPALCLGAVGLLLDLHCHVSTKRPPGEEKRPGRRSRSSTMIAVLFARFFLPWVGDLVYHLSISKPFKPNGLRDIFPPNPTFAPPPNASTTE